MAQPTEAPWGPGKPPFIIAEIGLTHEGSLGNALAFIDACADVGASAVKFQDHSDDPNDKFRTGFTFPQDENRRGYWGRTYLGYWDTIREHCHNHGVLFGCTPFSYIALEKIRYDVDFIKVARQFYDGYFHQQILNGSKPVLHTGPGGLGLNKYDTACHIGISDHSASIGPALDAFKRGAQVAELHVCWDRRQFGPDVQFSVTIDELGELVRAVR